jgi:hypothetical protein
MAKEKVKMAYTMDAPNFGRKMPEPKKGKPYALTVQDREMLRRVSTPRPVADATVRTPAANRAPVADARAFGKSQFQRNTEIADSIKAAVAKIWGRA